MYKILNRFAVLVLCLLISSTLVGCSTTSTLLADKKPTPEKIIETTDWPVNTFTDNIIKPSVGKIDYIIDESENGSYFLCFSDTSKEDSDTYINELRQLGYTDIVNRQEIAANGIILQNDNIVLSIAYADDTMCIRISKDK